MKRTHSGNNAIHIDGNTALESRSRILVSKLRCIVLVQMRGPEYELNSFSQQQAVVKKWLNEWTNHCPN